MKISEKALHFRRLGMIYATIAESLGVSRGIRGDFAGTFLGAVKVVSLFYAQPAGRIFEVFIGIFKGKPMLPFDVR